VNTTDELNAQDEEAVRIAHMVGGGRIADGWVVLLFRIFEYTPG